MTSITSAYRIEDLIADRAKPLAPPSYVTELTQISNVSFAYGLVDPELFPQADLAAAAAAVLQEQTNASLNYGPPAAQLVEQIILRLQGQGISASSQQVLVSYGSSQILALLLDVFIEPGDVVIIEGPSFLGAVGKFAEAGARLITVPVDALGMNIDALEMVLKQLSSQNIRPKFIYTIPTFHNPTGTTMPLDRRKKLLALAAHYGVLIVEDDAYGDLRFRGESVPTLASLDQEGWVLYVSTFSKIIAPGIRLGWAYGNPAVIERLGMFRSEGPSGPFMTHMVARFCADGKLEPHLQRLVTHYREKCDRMLGAIDRAFPTDVTATRPEGGFFVWCHLPPHLQASTLLAAANRRGVGFMAGTRCYTNGQGEDAIRLSFSFQPINKIEAGIIALGEVMHELISH